MIEERVMDNDRCTAIARNIWGISGGVLLTTGGGMAFGWGGALFGLGLWFILSAGPSR